MQDIHTRLSTISRPRLLISAARHGLADYDRVRHLGKMLGLTRVPSPGEAVMRLIDIEAHMDSCRVDGDGSYSVARHVDVLIALMAEAQLLRGPQVVP